MSLYYVLDREKFNGKESEIGQIMSDFAVDLFEKTGLKLCLYCGITDKEIEKCFNNADITVLQEEVLWKNMSDSDKLQKILDYVNKIRKDKKEIIITDPYLFNNSNKVPYNQLLEQILTKSQLKKITIITNNKNVNRKLLNYIKNAVNNVNITFKVYHSEEIHDRFWIGDDKGFIMGTSLNGVGSKFSVIQMLNDDDVKDLNRILKKIILNSICIV